VIGNISLGVKTAYWNVDFGSLGKYGSKAVDLAISSLARLQVDSRVALP